MLAFLNVNIYTAKKDEKQQLLQFFDKQKNEFKKPYLKEVEKKKEATQLQSKQKKSLRNKRTRKEREMTLSNQSLACQSSRPL
jgi:hypothetical protein